jgi:hypothetical protein
MKVMTVVLGLVLSLSATAYGNYGNEPFPKNPHPSLTPGTLCTSASEIRYPERIRYCNRDVESETKDQVVRQYDTSFGFKIEKIGRRNFKIDHYIPLCMGGSNEETNLWPQHPSVYEITDPIEPLLCQRMAEGKLKQADAVKLIKQAKNDLSQARKILESIQAL